MINYKYQNILTHTLLNNCKSHSLTFPPVTLSKIEKSDGIDKDVGACVPAMMGVRLCTGEQFGNICQSPFTLPGSCNTQQSLLLEISCSGMLAHIWRDTRLRILMHAAPVSRPTLPCPTVLEHCPHPLPRPPRSSLPRLPPATLCCLPVSTCHSGAYLCASCSHWAGRGTWCMPGLGKWRWVPGSVQGGGHLTSPGP